MCRRKTPRVQIRNGRLFLRLAGNSRIARTAFSRAIRCLTTGFLFDVIILRVKRRILQLFPQSFFDVWFSRILELPHRRMSVQLISETCFPLQQKRSTKVGSRHSYRCFQETSLEPLETFVEGVVFPPSFLMEKRFGRAMQTFSASCVMLAPASLPPAVPCLFALFATSPALLLRR